MLSKPHATECIKQSLVEVVGDSTAVLNFTEHVPHARPVDTLRVGTRFSKINNSKYIDIDYEIYEPRITICGDKL